MESLEARIMLSADLVDAPDFAPDHDHDHDHDHDESRHFRTISRWSRTATNGTGIRQGDSITLTWTIVADGTDVAGEGGVNDAEPDAPSDLIAFMDGIYGNGGTTDVQQKPWFTHFESSFDRWSQVSGLNFVFMAQDDGSEIKLRNPDDNPGVLGTRADMRIGGHAIDGNNEVLAYNYFPFESGDMVIDTNDNFYNNTANNSLGLRTTLMHELGHGLGFAHVSPSNGTFLMEADAGPFTADGPQLDDILAAHQLYGDARDKGTDNNTTTTATDLGVLTAGGTLAIGTDANDTFVAPTDTDFVSIDDNSPITSAFPPDVDVFKFEAIEPVDVNITLTPKGPTYTQNGAPGNSFNSAAQIDLTLDLIGPAGNVIATSNVGGLGVTESIANFTLPAAGTYFVRVRGDAAGADGSGASNVKVQLYQVDVSATATSATFDYGDAPDTGAGTGTGNYQTTATDSGPSHIVTKDLRIGTFLDGDDGTLQNAAATADDALNQVKTYTSVDVDRNITDNGTIESTLVIADAFSISDINVNLDISHTFTEDLRVTLIAPNGDEQRLFQSVGGSGDNFSNTTLDDQATTRIQDGSAPFNGTFRPEFNMNSVFANRNAEGTWKLRIQDQAGGEVGVLNSWSLTLTSSTDDEDGIIAPAELVARAGSSPSVRVSVINTTSTAATLYGWIDMNGDGVFSQSERASATVAAGTNTLPVTLNFSAIPSGFTGTTYARFRLSRDAAAANPTGAAFDGEVEDHVFTIEPGLLIDNDDVGYQEGGGWADSGLTGNNGSSTRFNTATGAEVTWNLPAGRTPGWYTVQLYNVKHPANATNAEVTVVHANGTQTSGFSQRDAPNGFVTIGTFFFDGTNKEFVKLSNSRGGVLRADAILVTATSQPPQVRIDNGQTGYSEFGAGWANSGLTGNGGSSTRFTPNTGSGFVYRTPAGLAKAWYLVRLYNVQHPSNTQNARVTITHGGATETRTLDQRNTPNGFFTLGTFFFDGIPDQSIRIENLGGGSLRADGIAFIPVVPPGPGKIDNGDAGYSEFGSWANSGLTGSDGSSTRFTSQVGAGATWRPPANLAAGWYTLDLYNVASGANTANARVTIKHAGNTRTLNVNPQALGNGYNAIGTFYFDGSGAEAVTIQNLAEGILRADAIRLRSTPPPLPTTIDNGQAGYSEFGAWGDSGLTGRNGSSTRFTSQTGAGATYRPANFVAGFYDVLVFNVQHPSNTTNARVTITHAGVTDTRTLDQRATPTGFTNIGTFFFDGSGSEAITLQNLGGVLRTDTVRLQATTPPQAKQTLTQRAGIEAIANSDAPTLTQGGLDSLIDDALAAWAAVGVDPSAFADVRFAIGDLAGDILGTYSNGLVTIDTNAAGHGWFVDTTPEDDVEFTGTGPAGFDLFTVLVHELGHHLGLADEFDADGSLLEAVLDLGERRHITETEVDLLADRDLVEGLLYDA